MKVFLYLFAFALAVATSVRADADAGHLRRLNGVDSPMCIFLKNLDIREYCKVNKEYHGVETVGECIEIVRAIVWDLIDYYDCIRCDGTEQTDCGIRNRKCKEYAEYSCDYQCDNCGGSMDYDDCMANCGKVLGSFVQDCVGGGPILCNSTP